MLIPRIRLYNTSQKAVRDIEVKLVSILDKKMNAKPKEAEGKLPCLLLFSNETKSRAINGKQKQLVDVFSIHKTFINNDIYIGKDGERISLFGPNRYEIKIEVTSGYFDDVISKRFSIGLEEDDSSNPYDPYMIPID